MSAALKAATFPQETADLIADAINAASFCDCCGERPHGPSYKRKCEGGTAVVYREELVRSLTNILFKDAGLGVRAPAFVERACRVFPQDEAVTDDNRSQF